jgi:hypothetical protein
MPKQLSLFKGKRQRGITAKPPLEFEIHCVIADIIRRWISSDWRYTHMPLGEERDHRINVKTGQRYSLSGLRLKRMGVTKGWPDFMFVGPGCQMFWLELKRPGSGRLSEEQVLLGAHLVACGHGYLATTSIDDAVETLKSHGILQSVFEVQ